MSELNLFFRSISLWFWLLMRLAVMAAILFGSLFLLRTIFDPGVRPFDANKQIDFPHFKYVALHAPLICTFWLSANAIFRTTGRKTATQFFGDDVLGFFVNAFIFGPILGALVVCVFGTPGYRAIAVGWVTGMAALPILLWILFEPGVFQSFGSVGASPGSGLVSGVWCEFLQIVGSFSPSPRELLEPLFRSLAHFPARGFPLSSSSWLWI